MTQPTAKAPQPRAGFTLIELLCAMSLFSLILLLATAMLGNTSSHYQRIGAAVEDPREARACLHQLTADLATAISHPDNLWEKSARPWPQDHVGFLHLQPLENQSEQGRVGDLCGVHYYIKDLTIDGRTLRCLMRGFRESRETITALKTGDPASLFVERPNLDEPIAFGVAAFQVRKVEGDSACVVRLAIVRREALSRLKSVADWEGQTKAGALLQAPLTDHEHPSLVIHEVKIHIR